MHAFLTHPGQWDLFRRERPATTAEETVRWTTPVNAFQRTATQDTELGGVRIAKGDRVGHFYASANRDPEVFADPGTFDITRDPNPHLGFAGLRLVCDPRRLRSARINGVKELRVVAA